MIYVALLRGINVGGKNKIDMKLLKENFEYAGMENVSTYLNTGNVIFKQDNRSEEEIVSILEAGIAREFGFDIKIVICSIDEITLVIDTLPETWINDPNMKSDVLFLGDEVDAESILEELIIKPEIDTVIYIPGAILWSIKREHQSTSGMVRLVGTKVYKKMTIRNVNTVRKIHQRMLETSLIKE